MKPIHWRILRREAVGLLLLIAVAGVGIAILLRGTIRIDLGDNNSFGGKVKTPFHQDFVFFMPTVALIDKDGVRTVLMRHGKFIPKIP